MIELQSEQINDLAASLSKAQADLGHAFKDSKNPHFKSSYASLESVIDVTKEPFAKNGLAVTQTSMRDDVGLVLVTTLMHTSGQWIRGFMPIVSEKNTAQGMGSGLTYARRYALAALAGVHQSDDDGNEASAKRAGNPFLTALDAIEQNLGDYVMPIGKYRGQKLQDIDMYELNDYLAKLVAAHRKQNKAPDGDAADMLNAAEVYLASREVKK